MGFILFTVTLKLALRILQLKGFLLYFVLFLISFVSLFLLDIPPFKDWLKKFDSALLNSACIQPLLLRSMQLETLSFSRNFVDIVCVYIVSSMFWLYATFGFLIISFDSISQPQHLFAVLCFFWASFYVRLRWNYLNYDHLKLDKATLSWEEFVQQVCTVENLSITDKINLKSEVRLLTFPRPTIWGIRKRYFGAGSSKIAADAAVKAAKKVKISEDVVTKATAASSVVSGVAAGFFLYDRKTSKEDAEVAAALKAAAEANLQSSENLKQATEILKTTIESSKSPTSNPPKVENIKEVSFFSGIKSDIWEIFSI